MRKFFVVDIFNHCISTKTTFMAEIISRKKGSKKAAPRVDLTPMVDLGFLLITFFIVTTSMTEPQAMKYNTPADGLPSETPQSKTLTLVLADNNKVFYYQGNDSLHYNSCGYDVVNGLREVIASMQIKVKKQSGKRSETVVLIKPTAQSNYKNIVTTIDEMLINNVTHYMVINASEYDEALAKK